jgi:hypothetical protein
VKSLKAVCSMYGMLALFEQFRHRKQVPRTGSHDTREREWYLLTISLDLCLVALRSGEIDMSHLSSQ